jgi:amino acid adenylation domain-containing protein
MQLPSQVIRSELDPALEVDDEWDELSHPLARIVEAEAHAELDLRVGPLLRVRLLRSPGGSQALVLTAHAAVADADSLLALATELCVDAGVADAEPLQYADYAEWRNESGAHGAGEQRDEVPSSVALFGNPPAQPTADSPVARKVAVPTVLASELEGASADYGVRRPLLIEACWHACVHRLSCEASVTIVGASTGRGHEELVGALGPFAQPLPVTSRFGEETSLAEVVDQVRRARDAGERAHDALSAAVLEETRRQAHIAFQSHEAPAGLDVVVVRAPIAGLALQLTWLETAQGPTAELLYDPSAYGAGDVDRVASAFEALLRAAASSPEALVEELPIVSPSEEETLRALLQGPQLDVARRTFHELFEEQVARAPDAVAVRDGNRSLTYAELNGSANVLAGRLRERGIGRGEAVGMCTYRSVESLVAVLGILKAGGAYLPLNFDHPVARLQAQLAQAEADVVVIESDLDRRLAGVEALLVNVSSEAEAAGATNPPHVGEPDDLAYVMYTSGSTGSPKGVGVTHANLVNYCAASAAWLRLDDDEQAQFAVVSAISTDLGNTAIFPALLSGGCVNLVAPETAMDPEAFASFFQAAEVDVLKITPSHLRALLAASDTPAVLPRRLLVLGGEALPWELVDEVRSRATALRIVNHYGPTETTIGSCTLELDGDVEGARRATVPIGRPIANTSVYVVDRRDRLVPPGVTGELLIGGAGVASGYVNRPDETAERFGLNPFGEGRVYRTGDRVRVLETGAIEFVGRLDDQVKVRGFRVEPGEVEAVLLGHPSVRHAAVKATVDGRGDAMLTAYTVSTAPVPAGDLEAFLASSLPDYMLPSAFVSIDAMPLTPGGKIDRQALPEPVDVDGRAAAYVAPRDDVEAEVTRVWEELLGIERVGVEDDFFALGGHSLLATQVIMRLRGIYGNVPLQAMFLSPTPAGLAGVIRESGTTEKAAS